MVKNRLSQQDAQESGWLLDGYPRSAEQAEAIQEAGIRPDVFILIDVRSSETSQKKGVRQICRSSRDSQACMSCNNKHIFSLNTMCLLCLP